MVLFAFFTMTTVTTVAITTIPGAVAAADAAMIVSFCLRYICAEKGR